jgi:pantetheine-phosphate adenylyltransferase
MKKITAVYAGTFDPVTNGHIDVLTRAGRVFPTVIVAVAEATHKKALFTIDQRVMFIKDAVNDLGGDFKVEKFNGLLVNFVKELGASIVIRGLRTLSDYEYEAQMALTNRKLDANIETVFFMTSDKYSFINSSIVKEVAMNGGDVSDFVPKSVAEGLRKAF